MAFNFTDDVFLLNLAFEAAERAFQRLVIAEFHFCQTVFTCLSINGNFGIRPSLPAAHIEIVAISEKYGC